MLAGCGSQLALHMEQMENSGCGSQKEFLTLIKNEVCNIASPGRQGTSLKQTLLN